MERSRTGPGAFRSCGIERLDIKIEPNNDGSAAIPRKLGFVEEATLRRHVLPVEADGPMRDALIFTMVAEEFERSEMATFAVQAADSRGEYVSLVEPI